MSSSIPPSTPTSVSATDDNEVVFYEGSPKLRGETALVFVCLLVAVVIALLPLAARWAIEDQWVIVAVICWILAPVTLLLPLLLVKKNKYRISNYRIDHEQGLLSKRIDTVELWHVDDVRMDQSVFDRILRVGTISVHSNDATSPKLLLRSLPEPRKLFDQIKQRVIAVKRQRGVLKIDTGSPTPLEG